MASISTCFISYKYPVAPIRKPHKSNLSQVRVLRVVKSKFDVGDVATKVSKGVESDRLSKELRNRAFEAVDNCGGRVTIGDVASAAGIKLNEAEMALQAIAADTGGFLEVSDEGDVLYVFPRDYKSKLAGKSFRMKVEPFIDKLKAGGEYLIRVSFGTALIASIVIVYTAIIALISSRSDEDNRGRRGGRSYNSGFTMFFNPTDLFWYWDPYYYRRRQIRKDDGMNFVESVFSFVFGDGDPNQGFEEKRWKMIGQYITSNGGVVTAEELAPYLDVMPTTGETLDDESYVLPVLLRFEGHPEVDDEGNILYIFPSLQRTASSQGLGRKEYVGKKWAEWVGGVEKYFEEKKWSLSRAGASEKAMAAGLGALNFFGVVVLGIMLKSPGVAPSGFICFVSEIFPLLQYLCSDGFFCTREMPKLRREILVESSEQGLLNCLIPRLEESRAGASEKAMAAGLGALNFFGVVVLGTMLKSPGVAPSGFISFVSEIFPLLQIYAASYFAIPLFRWFLLRKRNAEIEKRNLGRKQRARALELPDPSLRRKILSARDMASRKIIGSDNIVYTTEKDVSDQELDVREWDRKYKELES